MDKCLQKENFGFSNIRRHREVGLPKIDLLITFELKKGKQKLQRGIRGQTFAKKIGFSNIGGLISHG